MSLRCKKIRLLLKAQFRKSQVQRHLTLRWSCQKLRMVRTQVTLEKLKAQMRPVLNLKSTSQYKIISLPEADRRDKLEHQRDWDMLT